ncbi:hypothetical protein E2C01_025945 [Portunus trituberculatus]|uniref:Uncharacterized protein n=1 Tax=Portunus trituberculatus TaxID=210409 RepID=A0A5B7EHV5_PORTR|nr:hypothetical protein [Portunus trituberculatus]
MDVTISFRRLLLPSAALPPSPSPPRSAPTLWSPNSKTFWKYRPVDVCSYGNPKVIVLHSHPRVAGRRITPYRHLVHICTQPTTTHVKNNEATHYRITYFNQDVVLA